MISHPCLAGLFQKWFHVAHTNHVAASKIGSTTATKEPIRRRETWRSLESEAVVFLTLKAGAVTPQGETMWTV